MKRVLPIATGIAYSVLFSIYYSVAVLYGKNLPPDYIISWLLYYPTLAMGSLLFLYIGRIDEDMFYKRGVYYPISYFFGSVLISYILNDIFSPSVPLNKVIFGGIGALTLGIGIPALLRLKPWLKCRINRILMLSKKY